MRSWKLEISISSQELQKYGFPFVENEIFSESIRFIEEAFQAAWLNHHNYEFVVLEAVKNAADAILDIIYRSREREHICGKIEMKCLFDYSRRSIHFIIKDNGAGIHASKTDVKSSGRYFWGQWVWEDGMRIVSKVYRRESTQQGSVVELQF